jgi:hypothetical protein
MKYLTLLFGLFIGAQAMAEDEFDIDAYIQGSVEGMFLQNQSHTKVWGLGKGGTWNFDQDLGTIEWQFPDGRVAQAPMQIIGTFNPKDGTFLWAWDHPSIQEPLREHAKLVREFGRKHGIRKLTERKVAVTEDEAWEFVAIANRLAAANGGYRVEAGGPLVYMTLGEISLKKAVP